MAVDPLSMSTEDQHRVHRDQRAVQLLLRVGLAASVMMMLTGLVMKVVSGSRHSDGIRLFSMADAASVADATMAIGVLVLAVTPVFRVVALIVLWTRERDWRFVAVAVTVVVVLGLAVLLGHG